MSTQPISAATTMTAVAITAPGAADVLRREERPVPELRPGEVLIRVAVAGVNRHDIGQRRRGAAPPSARSDIPGLEVAGEVVASTSPTLAVGTRVAALTDGGGYAEFCAADAGLCLPIPPALPMTDAAALPEALFTIWFSLFELGGFAPGKSVLIHAAGGGVGLIGIQMARMHGATVIATASQPDKLAVLERLGATAVNYRSSNVVEAVRTATVGKGADVILDFSGADHIDQNIDAVRWGGRIVHMASGEMPSVALPLRTLMAKSAMVTGGLVRPLPLDRKRAIAQRLVADVWPAIGSAVVPVIDSTFPLEQAADAHRRIESRAAVGKVLLTTSAHAGAPTAKVA
ncbi:MAG TPA: NAD(P)H-quinone oxidoreductase [Beijerinckiaceae bacterium]